MLHTSVTQLDIYRLRDVVKAHCDYFDQVDVLTVHKVCFIQYVTLNPLPVSAISISVSPCRACVKVKFVLYNGIFAAR
jgi:hypothetical protein